MGAAVYTTTAIPVVTVILPARNAEAPVARATASLLKGTLQDLRLPAVDGGSAGTLTVLAGLAAHDPGMEQLDGGGPGLVADLNRALREALDLARMDADDDALPHRLMPGVAALEAEPDLPRVARPDETPVSPFTSRARSPGEPRRPRG
ncbi:glycosyltransferase [Myxococcus sp. CA051A]|nr:MULTISPECIES: glycosyltransferase [unclassified Myxococcus]NTX15282.1 glycosyltransferase [Myxococcus sp. CA056]NTX37964.1 glycosyltransferase [Myxococcus sp. CA033]NTX57641.1 glycosyltransferase [Myxococcus sp. CA039A]NTX61613.1 glycosyltransferase [Myxococcus sp. CA051A]